MMSESNLHLSEEDIRLIEENQLGEPLKVYSLKAGYIRFWRWASWFLIVIGIVTITFVVTMSFRNWQQSTILHQQQPHSWDEKLRLQNEEEQIDLHFYDFFPGMLGGVFGLIFGCICLSTAHGMRNEIT